MSQNERPHGSPGTATQSEIKITFLVGTTNKDKDGNDYTNGYDGFKIHPAFQDGRSKNFINDEWKKEIAGIWVAKFEMSREDSANSGQTWSQTTKDGNVKTKNAGNASYIRAVSKPRINQLEKHIYRYLLY